MATTPTLMPTPKPQFFAIAGIPLVGGKIYTYAAGTSTPLPTFSDAAGEIPQTNPIKLNSRGEPANPIFWLGNYRVEIRDALGNLIYTVDNFNTDPYGIGNFSNGTGASLIGFSQGKAEAVTRTVESKLRDFVNAVDYPSLQAAFNASDTVFVTSANYPVAANYTVAKTKNLIILGGGSLTISTGVTLTIAGTFEAPINRIFSGPGAVVGIRQVHPEWWGAAGDGATDDQPAFAQAHTCVQASTSSVGGTATILLASALYQFGSTWTISPTNAFPIAVVGMGRNKSLLTPSSTFPAGPVMLVDGNSNGSDNQFCLRQFAIIATVNGIGAATAGLQIGSEDPLKKLSGTNPNLIEDMYASGFPKSYYVVHARMINWVRVAGWNNTVTTASSALYITQKGAFTGDMTFDSCQFVGNITNAASTSISIVSNGGVANAQGAYTISGLRFNSTIVYQAAKQLYILAQNGSIINDIWFTPGCQFDGGGTNCVYMQCDTQNTILRNVNINGCYFSGPITGDIVNIVGGGGRLTDFYLTENFMNGSTRRAISVFNAGGQVGGFVISKNRMTENNNTDGAVIEIGGNVNNFSIEGNVANRITQNFFKYFISLQPGATQFTILGNNSGAIGSTGALNDLSGAVIKAVANNI